MNGAMFFSAESAQRVKKWADHFLPDQRSFLVTQPGTQVLALWPDDDPSSPPLRVMPGMWLVRWPDRDCPGFVGFEVIERQVAV